METASKTHGSLILLDALTSNPFELPEGYPALAKSQLQGYIDAVNQVMAQAIRDIPGYNEPFIIVTLLDGTEIETEVGYYHMDIQHQVLLLEDHPDNGQESNGVVSYHIIPIAKIKEITITCG